MAKSPPTPTWKMPDAPITRVRPPLSSPMLLTVIRSSGLLWLTSTAGALSVSNDGLTGRAGACEQAAVAREAGHTGHTAADGAAARVGVDDDVTGDGAADDGAEVQVLVLGESQRLDNDALGERVGRSLLSHGRCSHGESSGSSREIDSKAHLGSPRLMEAPKWTQGFKTG